MTTATKVRERPITFTGPSVPAILADRKTVTRRVVKITHRTPGLAAALLPAVGIEPRPRIAAELCPYGRPGDRLWVRETLKQYDDGAWYYAADGAPIELDADDENAPWMISWAYHQERDYCPSIHMPRWASRITLEITDVRVERVQEITEEDAIAEGVEEWGRQDGAPYPHFRFPGAITEHEAVPVFAQIWDSINAKRGYPFDANPWVWVIAFRRISTAAREAA